MIDGLKPYPAYKDSGVPWLGDVPERWDVRRVKHLFRCRKLLNDDGREKNVLSLTLRGVVNNDPENPEGLVPKDYATYQIFDRNDLVFKLIDLENLRTSRVGLVHEHGIMSSAYVRLTRTENGDTRFFYHQFFDLYTRGIYNQLGAGVRSTLGPSDLLNVNVLAPSISEQHAIVRFLDHADSRIRRYIRAKQKLIKLLEEQKQAIIYRAVTRGLDPNVRFKPSGVEWLGDVPAHWETCRVRYMTRILRGRFLHRPRNAPQFYDGEYAFIQTGDISAARKYIEGYSQTLNEKGLAISKMFPAGTLAMVITGAKTGHVAILGFDACFPDSAVGFLPMPGRADTEFLFYLFITLKKELDQAAVTSTQENLNVERIGGQVAAWPPLNEQKEIAQHLQTQTSIVDESSVKALKQINLVREFRTCLIADVVTGKLDVRDAVLRLPQEVSENAPLDELEDLPQDESTAEDLELEATDAA